MITAGPAVKSWRDAQGDSHNFLPNYKQRTPLEWAGLASLKGALGDATIISESDRRSYMTAYALVGLAAAIGNGVYGARVSGTGWGIGRGVLAFFAPLATTAYSIGQASTRR